MGAVEMMQRFDRDHDGLLDAGEQGLLVASLAPEYQLSMVDQFASADTSTDGKIDVRELAKMLQVRLQ